MKSIYGVMICILLLLVSACASKVDDPADIQAVKKSVEDYVKASNAGDADGVAALMTDKTVYADANLPVLVGKDAIKAQTQAFLSQMKVEFDIPVAEVRVRGDVAVARGTWKAKFTPKAQGVAPYADSGSWILVLARQGDGSWKWDWLVPNSDQPLPGSTATGAEEQALLQLERDWAAADLKRDTKVVEPFLADDFVSTMDGKVSNKKQILAEMKTDPAKIESAENGDMRAMVFGDTAIVTGTYIEKSTTNGKDSSQQIRYTEVYAKRNGRWQCVTQYLTKVK
jgi:uncharacterized protein (TIGR02246 family)